MNELVVFNPIKTEMGLTLPNLKTITKVVDDQGALVASLGLKSLTGMLSAAESLRKSVKQPHIDAGKLIDDHYKTMTTEAMAVQAQLKRVLLDWNVELGKRKEAERKALEEAKRIEDEKRQLEMARDVTPTMDDFDSLLKPDVQVQRETIIHQENLKVDQFVADKKHASAVKAIEKQTVKGVRKVWRFAIVDANLIPREFLTVDQPTVNAAIKEGKRDIPGLRIYEEEIMAARG
jgi:hypothetical protein